MNRKYLIALAVAVVLFVMSKTDKGKQVVSEAADAIGATVRGLRNNNPGNVREAPNGGDLWVGERASNDDVSFEEFTEMRYGVRAAAIVFRNYQRKYNLRSVAQLITRWAPPIENDTAAYIKAVAARVGVNDSVAISLESDETCYKFLRAIFRHECGPLAEAIPESTVREGVALA